MPIENQITHIIYRYFHKFIFIYLVLYIYPYGFEYIQELKPDTISFWERPTIWFGENAMGWQMNEDRLMKGFDSMYDYSRFVLIALVSFIGALI